MSKITFNYKGNEIVIPCKKDEKFGPILQRFYEKTEIQKESIYFLFNGQILDEEMNESQVPKNENNKKIIVAYDYQTNKINEKDILVRANEIVCPKCQESACISLNNYSISLFQCCNGHKVDNILFEDFDHTQNINLSSIICQICKIRNKGNVDNNEFFRCINCRLICALFADLYMTKAIILLIMNKKIAYVKSMESLILHIVKLVKKTFALVVMKSMMIMKLNFIKK